MENIEATKIERGIVVNTSKKVKISNWKELVKNAKELNVKVDLKAMDVQPDLNAKPEWSLVNMNSNEIHSYVAPKPIRIVGRGVSQAKSSWDEFRQQNIYSDISNESIPEFNSLDTEKENDSFEETYNNIEDNIYQELEDFGYGAPFAQAVEQTIEKPEFNENDETKEATGSTYTQDLSEIIKQATDRISEASKEDEFDNKETIEQLVREALKQPEKVEDKSTYTQDLSEIIKKATSRLDSENYNDTFEDSKESIDVNNLEINDLIKEITQITEDNDYLKDSIKTIENRNEKMLNTYHGIEQETNKYRTEALKNAKEILSRKKEEKERLISQKEEAINEGRNIKSNWISADEDNLKAKQLLEMLNSNYSSQSEETTYKKVA